MNESKQRERERGRDGEGLEVGDSVNFHDFSAEQRRGGGTKCRPPFRCPSCVQPVREQRQYRRQLVTGTAGRPAIATAREVTHRPQSVNGKCGEEIKALL